MLKLLRPRRGGHEGHRGAAPTGSRMCSRSATNYGLDKWLFEIERHGEAGDPKTTYSILPDGRSSMTVCVLRSRSSASTTSRRPCRAVTSPKVTAPRASRRVAAPSILATRANSLGASSNSPQLPTSRAPSSPSLAFERVRDLKASDVAEARQALDRLEAAMRAADNSIDPFA